MKLRIKEARERAGFSQKELANRIGVAPNTFNGYEKGNHDPKTSQLVKIALECKTSMDYLLGQTNDPTPVYEKKAPETEVSEAQEKSSIVSALTNMLQSAGWIGEDGDISDEDWRFLRSVAAMLDSYFEEQR